MMAASDEADGAVLLAGAGSAGEDGATEYLEPTPFSESAPGYAEIDDTANDAGVIRVEIFTNHLK